MLKWSALPGRQSALKVIRMGVNESLSSSLLFQAETWMTHHRMNPWHQTDSLTCFAWPPSPQVSQVWSLSYEWEYLFKRGWNGGSFGRINSSWVSIFPRWNSTCPWPCLSFDLPCDIWRLLSACEVNYNLAALSHISPSYRFDFSLISSLVY